MKKHAFYVGAIVLMLLMVLLIPRLNSTKNIKAAAASTPLVPHSSGNISDSGAGADEGDSLEVPYLKNGADFQEHVKVEDYAGISDSIVSVMSCLKDSLEDPSAYYDINTRTVLNTLGFGDKDIFLSFVSAVKDSPSYAVAKDIEKKDGYFYVVYDLYGKDDNFLCSLEANHLFMRNRYAASEYRLKK